VSVPAHFDLDARAIPDFVADSLSNVLDGSPAEYSPLLFQAGRWTTLRQYRIQMSVVSPHVYDYHRRAVPVP
jgi:hypothetical protein